MVKTVESACGGGWGGYMRMGVGSRMLGAVLAGRGALGASVMLALCKMSILVSS